MAATQETDELRALSRLTFSELGDALGGIGGVHRGIAERVFRHVGAGAEPARLLHDAISGGVYRALRGATSVAGLGADAGLAHRSAPSPALSSTPRGALALAALNGLIGDRLEREGSPLAAPMAVRVDGAVVPMD